MKEVQNTKIKIQKTPEKINEIHDLLSVLLIPSLNLPILPLAHSYLLGVFHSSHFTIKTRNSSGIALFNHKWL